MKILRIKLRNLNSLRGEHEVNFEAYPLAGAGLFAITGPTGAGKSTLLDAITLALYGKAARYGADPSPEDTMSRHCGECFAEVVFQVPSGTFRAEWQLRRANGNPDGRVQAPKRYLYDLTGQTLTQNIRETEAKIETLVGLDYPRFLRSALLAQGDFAQFLKAKPDERAGLLESLTGTSIYSELGALAYAEFSRREQDLSQKQVAIQQIQLLPEEQRQKFKADIPEGEARFDRLKLDLAQAANLLNKATNLAESLESEKRALETQRVVAKQLKDAESDLHRLASHRLTIPFHGDLASLKDAENAATTMRGLFGQAATEQSSAASKVRLCLLEYRRMVAEQVEKTKAEINKCKEKLAHAAKLKGIAEKWLLESKSDQDLSDKLADLGSGLAALKNARRDSERGWAQLCKLAGKFNLAEPEALTNSQEETALSEVEQILTRLNKVRANHQAAVASAKKAADAALKLREDHLAKAKLVADLSEHRAGLKPGEPCPLCGAKTHPYSEGAEPSFPFKDLEALVEEARQTCKARQKEVDDLIGLKTDLQVSGQAVRNATGEFHDIQGRLAKDLKGLSLIVPARGKEDETKTILQKRAAEYRAQSAAKEGAEREHATVEVNQKNLADTLAALQEKQSGLLLEPLPDQVEDHAPLARPNWSSLTAADKDWNTAKNVFISATTNLTNRQKDSARLEQSLLDLQRRLAAALNGSPFTGIPGLLAARLVPAESLRVEKLETDLTKRRHESEANLRTIRESIVKWREEAAPEGQALTQLKDQHAALQIQHDQLIRDLNTWKMQLSQDEVNRQAIAAKQKELESDRERLEVWRQLRCLIGSHDGRTFRRYAQTLSLDILVRYANRHLLRLSERYRLRRREGEELDLEIEDFHQAGAVRPMASLSGGESFLASLALALGLSDLAGRNVRIDSLFIDEGLSSLDSETLDLAISALETLQQDTKTVGVISHVDLLKERIATQIIVEKQSGGTSTLRLAS